MEGPMSAAAADPVRMGCLGAARIAPAALVKPARKTLGVQVAAIAARDVARAKQFALHHGIPVVHDSYEDLLADGSVDAVYNPLPNGLHALWTLRALEAGKHVLCEKPFTANAAEARRVADAAASCGLVVMEAFHWRYHPLAARMLQVIAAGELGPIRHVEATVAFPLFKRTDIRWNLDLAGGALMDAGCYPVHMVRTIAGAEPTVAAARSRLRAPGVDRWMQADLAFDDGRSGRITASMWSSTLLGLSIVVVGERATMKVFNPLGPQIYNRLTVKGSGTARHERVAGGHTYDYQLAAFAAAVQRGEPVLTPPSDSVANMAVIDAIYLAAGMEPRRGATD
jgi:predicted dehydrogenase